MSDIEKSKRLAELSKDLRSAESKVKQYKEYLESDIKFGRDTTRNRINLEYAIKKRDEIQREIDKLM